MKTLSFKISVGIRAVSADGHPAVGASTTKDAQNRDLDKYENKTSIQVQTAHK